MAKTLPILSVSVAAIAVVALLGLGGADEPAPRMEVQDAGDGMESATYAITPQEFKASRHTGTVNSQDFVAARSDTRTEWDVPDPLPDADATHGPSEMWVKTWNAHNRGVAFDSEGNLFSHGEYEVSRIDVSTQRQTVWTMPEGWGTSDNSFSTVDGSGHYYFVANGKLVKLDHNTGVFTMWDVSPKGMRWTEDGIYFVPVGGEYISGIRHNYAFPFLLSGGLDLNVTRAYIDRDVRISGEGASGYVKVMLVLPSGEVHVKDADVNRDATFHARFSNIFTPTDISDGQHLGEYTITASDLLSTSEMQVEVNRTGYHGQYPDSSTTNPAILQRLDPNTNALTTFFTDAQIFPAIGPGHLSTMSDGGAFYYPVWTYGEEGIVEFTPSTGDIKHWSGVPAWGAIAVSDKKVYWGNNIGRDTLKIVELDPDTGDIREVTSPHAYPHYGFISAAVDGDGSLYFTGNHFYKFDTSANTFKRFHTNLEVAGIGADGTIYGRGEFWRNSIVAMTPVSDDEAPKVTILPGVHNNTAVYWNAVTFDVRFDEDVSGFESSDILLLNSTEGITIHDLYSRPTQDYSNFYVHAPGGANLTIRIPEGSVIDHSHNGNVKSAKHTVILRPLSDVSQEDKDRWLEQQHHTIYMAYRGDWGPFEFQNSTGHVGGITARYAELLGEVLDVRVETDRYRYWDDIYRSIDAGYADVALMGSMYDTSLTWGVQFTDPHMTVPVHIATITDRGISAENLDSHDLVVIDETVLDHWLYLDGIDRRTERTYEDAVLDLSDGRYDALLAPYPVAQYHGMLQGVSEMHDAGPSGYEYDLRVAYSDQSPVVGAIMQDAMGKIPAEVRAQMLADAGSPGNGDPAAVITSGVANATVVESDRVSFAADFGETVTGFRAADIVLLNTTTAHHFSIENFNVTDYTFDVVSTGNGPVAISIPAGAVSDLYGNPSTASEEYVVTFDIPDES